ncbi:hypothetical protein [Desulfosarcina ovata]|uniref:PBP domain-containing protein n=1 Tax=Desulfosarcina ovata subsp. ovata TaxID=2752305 RepID=A0A5K8AJS0_9BACT|nr:hypothetical protein [Desulfosarcina ovata]BBO92848.1 hypothetical protein DSCOOX_60280 [Desulfosarcina ovata subsp. ovata]
MFKKVVKGALIGAAAFMIAAPAQATIEIHLFGASAQYKFWTSAAPEFLASPSGADCQGIVQHALKEDVTDTDTLINPDGATPVDTRDAGAAQGFDCQGTGEHVVITYTTFASIAGIQAVKGSTAFDNCANGEAAVPDWDNSDGDNASITWGTYPAAAGTVDDLTCKDITIGASDVAGETFGQESHGELYGPDTSGGWYDSYANPEDTTGLDNCQPIIVPFSFYAHKDTAINSTVDLEALYAGVCDPELFGWWDTTILPGSITGNMTRLMATLIFAGHINNWADFGYSAQAITACMRHAGSGTHATLDADVFRGDAVLAKTEVLPGSFAYMGGATPVVYFNKGSSDMMSCIDTVGAGAVGYADSDKNGGAPDGSDKNTNIVRLTYMGADGNAHWVKYGVYDFWSAQWLYWDENESTEVKEKIAELCAYASEGDNIPCSRKEFWVAGGDMRVYKADDFTWPKKTGNYAP